MWMSKVKAGVAFRRETGNTTKHRKSCKDVWWKNVKMLPNEGEKRIKLLEF